MSPSWVINFVRSFQYKSKASLRHQKEFNYMELIKLHVARIHKYQTRKKNIKPVILNEFYEISSGMLLKNMFLL